MLKNVKHDWICDQCGANFGGVRPALERNEPSGDAMLLKRVRLPYAFCPMCGKPFHVANVELRRSERRD